MGMPSIGALCQCGADKYLVRTSRGTRVEPQGREVVARGEGWRTFLRGGRERQWRLKAGRRDERRWETDLREGTTWGWSLHGFRSSSDQFVARMIDLVLQSLVVLIYRYTNLLHILEKNLRNCSFP
jgi:hypothetical protein